MEGDAGVLILLKHYDDDVYSHWQTTVMILMILMTNDLRYLTVIRCQKLLLLIMMSVTFYDEITDRYINVTALSDDLWQLICIICVFLISDHSIVLGVKCDMTNNGESQWWAPLNGDDETTTIADDIMTYWWWFVLAYRDVIWWCDGNLMMMTERVDIILVLFWVMIMYHWLLMIWWYYDERVIIPWWGVMVFCWYYTTTPFIH